MTPIQAEELVRTLKTKALTLEDLHERVRTSGSAWTVDQVCDCLSAPVRAETLADFLSARR